MFRAALHMVISDFFHLRLGGGSATYPQGVYSVCSSRPAFPTGPPVCWGGGGGGGGGCQQASSLSSKHKLWNFHRSCYLYNNTLTR